MSRSTLMTLLEMVVPVVSSGISCAHRGAECAIVRLDRGQELDHLSIEIDRDESLTILVERGDRRALVVNATVEHQRWFRGKAKGEVPDRRGDRALEDDADTK